MTSLLIPWLAFPLLLLALSLGCGLLIEAVAGYPLPGTLLLPSGLAALIVVALFVTMNGATARFASPAVIAVAVAGYMLALGRGRRRPDPWALGSCAGVFAVYAAPVVLSGQATFPGYIKLDDDATFLANLDRAMEHGRNIAGLAPSSYLATLQPHLAKGYPLGALMPIGVGRELVGGDSMWLYQPTVAAMAAMLALALYELSARVVERRWLRALAAFVGAQSALLYGYALWGGIKEVAGAYAIALTAALVVPAVRGHGPVRRFIPLAVSSAALLGMLSLGAVIWLGPALLAALVGVFLTRSRRTAARTVVAFAAALAVLAIPTLVAAPSFLANRIFEYDFLANLAHALNPLQLAGIWPTGDFRFTPGRATAAYALSAIAAAAAAAGVIWALRRGARALPVYAVGVVVSCFVFFIFSTPWIEGKALATASPAVPMAALVACAPLFRRRMRIEGAVLATLVTGGVLWSNVLQYHDAWLAPRAQLHELEVIGNRFAGAGPTLMTEFNPYGARHFLRKLDAEGAAELRIRPVPLRTGQLLPKGGYADLDQFRLDAVLVYRTLVLRRSPLESRPPSEYRLVWKGRFYEVWQRPATELRPIVEHLPLGSADQASAVPSCAEVRRLARLAGPRGELAAVVRPPAVEAVFGSLPQGWAIDEQGDPIPAGKGVVDAVARIPTAGRYSLWLGGSVRDRLNVSVDGRHVGSVRDQLNNADQYTPLGSARLAAGRPTITLAYDGPDLRPGSGGVQFPMGPLLLSASTADAPVTYVRPADARSLCGKSLDWVEALGA